MRQSAQCPACYQAITLDVQDGEAVIPPHGSLKKPCSAIGKTATWLGPLNPAPPDLDAISRKVVEKLQKEEPPRPVPAGPSMAPLRPYQAAVIAGMLVVAEAAAPRFEHREGFGKAGHRRFPVPQSRRAKRR